MKDTTKEEEALLVLFDKYQILTFKEFKKYVTIDLKPEVIKFAKKAARITLINKIKLEIEKFKRKPFKYLYGKIRNSG